jgi:hypothetical protein
MLSSDSGPLVSAVLESAAGCAEEITEQL